MHPCRARIVLWLAVLAPLLSIGLPAKHCLGQPLAEGYRPLAPRSAQENELPRPRGSDAEPIPPGESNRGSGATPDSGGEPPPTDAMLLEAAPSTPIPRIWSGNIEFGLDGTEGNQESFNIRAGGKAVGKYPWVTQTYETIFLEKTANGATVARNAIADARWEMPLWNPRWSYYSHGRLEYDEFKPFDLRIAADTGLAFDWIKSDVNHFLTRSGVSTSKEIGSADDEWKPELAFGLEWRYTIDARQKINLKSDYFPNVTDFSDYRLNSQADWEFAVSPEWNLSLKLSAIHRYDSTPNGAKPNDLNYAALVLWNF